MKKISVMLTSFNLKDYIDESISSVVKQEFPCNWELIIGDDGSTDGTINKIKDWQSKYPNNIRFVVHDRPNTLVKDGYRAGKNRASLLEMATGDYLIFLDGDDCWFGTEKIKTQYDVLENPNNNDCSCCAHNIQAYVIPENRKYSWENEDLPSRKYSLEEYWSYFYFHTNTILFRSECKQILLNDLYRDHLNDNFITFLLLQFGKIYYLNYVWARYNMTGQGLWTGHKKVYGALRNAVVYDLEMLIRPSAKRYIIKKYRYSLITLLREYNNDCYDDILPIISPLDPNIFKTTFLLSKKRPYSCGDRMRQVLLWIRIYYNIIQEKLHVI